MKKLYRFKTEQEVIDTIGADWEIVLFKKYEREFQCYRNVLGKQFVKEHNEMAFAVAGSDSYWTFTPELIIELSRPVPTVEVDGVDHLSDGSYKVKSHKKPCPICQSTVINIVTIGSNSTPERRVKLTCAMCKKVHAIQGEKGYTTSVEEMVDSLLTKYYFEEKLL